MLMLGLGFVFAILGGVVGDDEGAVFGGIAGMFLGVWLGQRAQLKRLAARADELEQALRKLNRELGGLRGGVTPSPASPSVTARPVVPSATAAAIRTPVPSEAASAPTGALHPTSAAAVETAAPANVSSSAPAPVEPPAPAAQARAPSAYVWAQAGTKPDDAFESRPATRIDEAIAALREFLLGGNTVARVGILVLLVGVTLLLKYAAEHALFPIELRMAGAGLIGLALIVLGLRQRSARPGFARTLQGGGVAAMYLVVFFSYRAYSLLPAPLAFGMLVAIAASSAVLAVVQDAMALVVIGQIGGFLAPILASKGGGSHVALFSYYLVLNCATFGIALFRAWRAVNLIGFVFTFGIGAAWGVTRYEPEHFASTEPFLVAFLLLYVGIAVIFALRHEAHGFLDGTLVFGAPLAFLALQLAMVRGIPFAMAYSALGLAALYLGLAAVLQRRAPAALRAMIEAFLALGVGFGTLAVPYGFDNAGLTSATWAIEGAGLYWIGVRQARRFSRAAGAVLQVLAGVALAIRVSESGARSELPILNTRTLAATLLCLSSLYVARHAYKHRERLAAAEWKALQALIVWGLCFFIPLGFAEIDDHLPAELRAGAYVALLGAVALGLELAGAKLAHAPLRYPPLAIIALLVPLAAFWELDLRAHLLSHGGWFGWPIYVCAIALALRRFVPVAPAAFRNLHPLALVGLAFASGLEVYRAALDLAGLSRDWAMAAAGTPAIALLAFITSASASTKPIWPFSEERARYMGSGALALAGCIGLWVFAFDLNARGNCTPLEYLPIVNPIDLAQLLGFAAILGWQRAYRSAGYAALPSDLVSAIPAVLTCFAFFWWNAMLARSVHQLGGIPFDAELLWHSVPLQVALSISWSAIALGMTVLASRYKARAVWIAGAVLLGVVVVKLFAIDLARLSTLARIGTFLVVGVLLLTIGYLAPVPPLAKASSPRAPEPAPDLGAPEQGEPKKVSP